MTVQYIHDHLEEYHSYNGQKEIRKTYYIELPEYSELLERVVEAINRNDNSPSPIDITIGQAVCHPKDNYNKAIGRDVAEKKKQLRSFDIYYIVSLINSDNKVTAVLKCEEIGLQLTVELKKNFNQVRVLSIHEE